MTLLICYKNQTLTKLLLSCTKFPVRIICSTIVFYFLRPQLILLLFHLWLQFLILFLLTKDDVVARFSLIYFGRKHDRNRVENLRMHARINKNEIVGVTDIVESI